ncbi:MAG: LuxR family transcriptional regulator, partial [Coriobacteriales bacterium]|nr:LuxR family transcriptional regulator [Coriobacteriales bacterium]
LIAGILSTIVWYGTSPVDKGDTWIVTLLPYTVLLVVGIILTPRIRPLTSRPSVIIASGCVIAAGIALVSTAFNFTAPGDALFVGCFLTGVGAAPLGICWRERVETVGPRHMRRQVFSASMVASVLLFLVAFSLPYLATMTICVLAPIGSAVLFLRSADSHGGEEVRRVGAGDGAGGGAGAGTSAGGGAGAPSPRAPNDRSVGRKGLLGGLRKLAGLLVCCFVLSFAQGVFKSGALSVDTQLTWTLVTSCAILLVLAVVVIDLGLFRKSAKRGPRIAVAYRLFLPLAVVGCLTLPFFTSAYPVLVHFFIFAGNFLLIVYLYSEIAAVRSDTLTPPQVFAAGIIAANIGCILGLLLEKTVGFESLIALYGVLYLVVGVAAVLRYELRKPEEADVPEALPLPTGAESGRPHDRRKPDLLDNMTKQCRAVGELHSLSERECDILTLLVRGKSANTIAEMSFISYNTVKTHIAHIYQKLGVHGKEEAIQLVEDFFRPE